jgi:AbiV family abortive infection protein
LGSSNRNSGRAGKTLKILSQEQLLDNQLHAPALSLSVLALEELGKLVTIDGLLYARSDDDKTKLFDDAKRSHDTKLGIFDGFPLILPVFFRADPRYGKEAAYARALYKNGEELKATGNAVLVHLGSDSFRALDKYKQRGFYASTTDCGIMSPRENVDPVLARLVHTLAWRATTSIDFVFKGGNLERYIEQARDIRNRLTEEEHQALELLGEQEAQRLFEH